MRSADRNGKCIRSDEETQRGKAPCPYAQTFDLRLVLDTVTKVCMARNDIRSLLKMNR